MKTAVFQFDVRIGDVAANLAAATRAAEQAAAAGADLVVFPEMAASGYAFESKEELGRFAETASVSSLGPALTGWAELAREHNLFICGGFPEVAEGAYYNSAALVGRDGLVGVYRKVHLFHNEKNLFEPGDLGFPVFDLPFGRVGMQVCYDIFFPESARSLVLGGAQLILSPGNFVRNFRRQVYDARGFTQACVAAMGIASQNQVYFALSDRIGEERGIGFIGASILVGWDGWPLAGPASGDEEELLVADMDLAEATRKRQRNPLNHGILDRRPDAYRTEADAAAYDIAAP
ncbi:MAG: nitrilase-related carbon-nitrogen hydrolase [Candidatus Dormibacteria bacterium]